MPIEEPSKTIGLPPTAQEVVDDRLHMFMRSDVAERVLLLKSMFDAHS